MSDAKFQIGYVADAVGLSLRTIRHYDQEGSVVPSQRTVGGFRLYSEKDIERLRLIKRMKPLGFSLQEMRELLEAHDQLEQAAAAGVADPDALARLARFLDATGEKLEKLRKHVAWAEEFSETIRDELVRYGQSSGVTGLSP